MPLRFKFLSVVYIMLVLVAWADDWRMFDGFGGILGALACLLVLSVMAIIPNSSRADRVDRAMSGSNWADRIDLDQVANRRDKH